MSPIYFSNALSAVWKDQRSLIILLSAEAFKCWQIAKRRTTYCFIYSYYHFAFRSDLCIKKCAGCPFEFLDASGPTFTGLVVRHCGKDFYIDKTGHRMVGRETNRYYHCENGCLLNRHPYFSAALIRLEPGRQLNSFQLNHLQRALHVQFQWQLSTE